MFPHKRDTAIVNELFNENNIDTDHSSIIYDEAGHVIKLSLSDAALDKSSLFELPTNFGELTHLQELYIYASLACLPANIGQLANLRAFVLSRPYPADAFPPEFAQLRNLRYLGLGELQWQHVPLSICQLPSLRVLDLSENQLTRLPAEIGQLTQLRILYLMYNPLVLLPAEIGQLAELEILDVTPHKLQTLPDEIACLRKLRYFYLSEKLLEDATIAGLAHEMGMTIKKEILAFVRRSTPSTQESSLYPCPCCGYLTVQEAYDICPVCFWELDPMQGNSPSSAIGANRCCLIEARLNFVRTGTCEDRLLSHVRLPLPEEIPEKERRSPETNFGMFWE